VRARLAFLGAAVAGVGAVTARFLRRRRPPITELDPRAGELRERLAESRAVVAEREEFEAGETAVDEVEPVHEGAEQSPDVDERRRELH
jgi:hypothetical protein